jgi:hypothetical protein
VAAVIADRRRGQDAAEAVVVDIDPLPAVTRQPRRPGRAAHL